MSGRATLTMVTSTSSMKIAMETATSVHQLVRAGPPAGRQDGGVAPCWALCSRGGAPVTGADVTAAMDDLRWGDDDDRGGSARGTRSLQRIPEVGACIREAA